MAKKHNLYKTVVRDVSDNQDDGWDFILSDATVDRYGDIIQSDGWELNNFKNNPIALFNHNPNFVIGSWEKLAIRDKALRGTLKMAPKGTSERIDEIRKLIDAGILRAVSVGFSPISYKEYQNDKTYGYIYEKCELVETSLVSVPANPNALLQVKALKISAETQEVLFGKHADLRATLARRENISRPVVKSFLENEVYEEQRRSLRYQLDNLTRRGVHWSAPEYRMIENRIKSLG
jgi:HK97 family phage prohead protease